MNLQRSLTSSIENLYRQFYEIPLPHFQSVDSLFPKSGNSPTGRQMKLQRTVSSVQLINKPAEESSTLTKFDNIINGIKNCLNRTNCLSDTPSMDKLKLLAENVKTTVDHVFAKSQKDRKNDEVKELKLEIAQLIKLLELCKKQSRKFLSKNPNFFQRCPAQFASKEDPLSMSFRAHARDNHVPYISKINLPQFLEEFFSRKLIESMKLKLKKDKHATEPLELIQTALEKYPIHDFSHIKEFKPFNEDLAKLWNRLLMSGEIINLYLPPCTTPGEELSRKIISKRIWDNKKDLFKAMRQAIPKIQVDAGSEINLSVHASLHNNYGLRLAESPKMDDERKLTFRTKTKDYVTPPKGGSIRSLSQLKLLYNPKTSQLFTNPGPMTMCDAISLPDIITGQPTVATLCDGCGLGTPSQQAAEIAAITSRISTEKKLNKPRTLRKIVKIMLKSMLKGHEKIIQSFNEQSVEMIGSCGTTTFLHFTIINRYLIGINLGDCKLFLIRSSQSQNLRECIDLTACSRDESLDGSDPGGRLGPEVEHNKKQIPQLNNLSVHIAHLAPGDLIIAASDGLADNLDPMIINEPPFMYGFIEDKWDNNLPAHREARKKAAEAKILEIIQGKNTIAEISQAIDDYAAEKVETYLANQIIDPPKSKFNMTKDKFPGKPDHKAHIVLRIEPLDDLY